MKDLQAAIAYIEANLTEELSVEQIAAQACISPFHFQHLFRALWGMPVGEYIRKRRLTLAAQELVGGGIKVIDAASKYGYTSPDSFARAFSKFHGILPSQAGQKGVSLNAVMPLKAEFPANGSPLAYKIMEKPQLTVVGRGRIFSFEDSYAAIPKFWEEVFFSEKEDFLQGMYGICIGQDGDTFEYLIADPLEATGRIPEGYVTRIIPAGTWAVFPCCGPLQNTLQSTNTRIWQEWLPSCVGYRLTGNYNLEWYTPPQKSAEDDYCEIWIPVTKERKSWI